MDRIETIAHDTPGVKHTQAMSGNAIVLQASAPTSPRCSSSSMIRRAPVWISDRSSAARLNDARPWSEVAQVDRPEARPGTAGAEVVGWRRTPKAPSLYSEDIANTLRRRFTEEVPEADVKVYPPPPVRGVGRAGGFNMIIEDRGDLGIEHCSETDKLVTGAARSAPERRSIYVPGELSIFARRWDIDSQAAGDEDCEAGGRKAMMAVHRVPRQRPAVLRRREPDRVHGQGRRLAGHVRDAAGLPRLALRQRLQPLRPHLAGDRPGRGAVPRAVEDTSS